MGVAQALNAVARSVGPLWCKIISVIIISCFHNLNSIIVCFLVDATYEGMEKRTFLAMALSLVCYSAILIGVILVYPKLTPPPQSTSTNSDLDDSDSDYITLRQIDSMSDSDFMP